MTLHLHSPAPLADLAWCCGTGSLLRWSALRVQAECGRSWSLTDEAGTAIAAAGIVAGGCWFVAAPGARPRMREVVRVMRRILGTVPEPLQVEARTAAGARLAALCGFRPGIGVVWERPAHG